MFGRPRLGGLLEHAVVRVDRRLGILSEWGECSEGDGAAEEGDDAAALLGPVRIAVGAGQTES